MTRKDNTPPERDINFNSHAHVERDEVVRSLLPQTWYFNSHAHVERDVQAIKAIEDAAVISTHTLTWSVTVWAPMTDQLQ